jgi:hypothetical protein
MQYVARRSHPVNMAQARLREILRERDAILRAFPGLRLPTLPTPQGRTAVIPPPAPSARFSPRVRTLKEN